MKLLLVCGSVFAAIFVGGLLLTREETLPSLPVAPAQAPAAFHVARVVDGDTFVLAGGEKVRILNIDTAEMPPRSRCPREEQLAVAAKVRTSTLLQGQPVTLTRQGRDRDRFDRLLRRVSVDGRDVGELLIREGLAQRWEGHKAAWC